MRPGSEGSSSAHTNARTETVERELQQFFLHGGDARPGLDDGTIKSLRALAYGELSGSVLLLPAF